MHFLLFPGRGGGERKKKKKRAEHFATPSILKPLLDQRRMRDEKVQRKLGKHTHTHTHTHREITITSRQRGGEKKYKSYQTATSPIRDQKKKKKADSRL